MGGFSSLATLGESFRHWQSGNCPLPCLITAFPGARFACPHHEWGSQVEPTPNVFLLSLCVNYNAVPGSVDDETTDNFLSHHVPDMQSMYVYIYTYLYLYLFLCLYLSISIYTYTITYNRFPSMTVTYPIYISLWFLKGSRSDLGRRTRQVENGIRRGLSGLMSGGSNLQGGHVGGNVSWGKIHL